MGLFVSVLEIGCRKIYCRRCGARNCEQLAATTFVFRSLLFQLGAVNRDKFSWSRSNSSRCVRASISALAVVDEFREAAADTVDLPKLPRSQRRLLSRHHDRRVRSGNFRRLIRMIVDIDHGAGSAQRRRVHGNLGYRESPRHLQLTGPSSS